MPDLSARLIRSEFRRRRHWTVIGAPPTSTRSTTGVARSAFRISQDLSPVSSHRRPPRRCSPQPVERPNGLINLIYVAALLLAVGVVTLGIGLFQA